MKLRRGLAFNQKSYSSWRSRFFDSPHPDAGVVLRLQCTHPAADLRRKCDRPVEHRIYVTQNGSITFLDHAGSTIKAMELQVKALHDTKKIRGCFLVAHLMYHGLLVAPREPNKWDIRQSNVLSALYNVGKHKKSISSLTAPPFKLSRVALEELPTEVLTFLTRVFDVSTERVQNRSEEDRYAEPLYTSRPSRFERVKRYYVKQLSEKINRVQDRADAREKEGYTVSSPKKEDYTESILNRIFGA